jgi:hypothetical protein
MGIFFRSKDLGAIIGPVIEQALQTPAADAKDKAGSMITKVKEQAAGPGPFNWGRLVIAVLLLLAVGGGGMYASFHTELAAWATALLHAFEVLFGVVVGLLGGEAAAHG